MRHEKIITQNGFLNILNKFHRLSKEKNLLSTDELMIEVMDEEVLEKIEVPLLVEKLAESTKMSLQDMISCILKCFVLDYTMGRTELNKLLFNYIEEFNPENKKDLLKFLLSKIKIGD